MLVFTRDAIEQDRLGGKEGAAWAPSTGSPMNSHLKRGAKLQTSHDRDVFTLTGLRAAGDRTGDVLNSLIWNYNESERLDLEVLVERPGPVGPNFMEETAAEIDDIARDGLTVGGDTSLTGLVQHIWLQHGTVNVPQSYFVGL